MSDVMNRDTGYSSYARCSMDTGNEVKNNKVKDI